MGIKKNNSSGGSTDFIEKSVYVTKEYNNIAFIPLLTIDVGTYSGIKSIDLYVTFYPPNGGKSFNYRVHDVNCDEVIINGHEQAKLYFAYTDTEVKLYAKCQSSSFLGASIHVSGGLKLWK